MLQNRRVKLAAGLLLLTWLVISPMTTGLAVFSMNETPRDKVFLPAAPVIDSPDDLLFENGSLGEEIRWNATSDEPKNYSISRDAELYESGAWDGSEIVVDLDHIYDENLTHTLPVSFEFVCVVFDMQNESAIDTVIVDVIADELGPIIVAPANFTYEVGSFGHEITWNITETNPDTFNVTRQSNEPVNNFTVVVDGDWDGSNITVNVDGLNASRWYLYTLFVNDTLGHNSTSIVNVTVLLDLTDPTITSPDDMSFEFGSGPFLVEWFAYDSNPLNYTIEVFIQYNDTEYGNVSEFHSPQNVTQPEWEFEDPEGGDIRYEVSGLFLGNYTLNITLYDEFDHNATDSVEVNIYRDIRAPEINATEDFSYEEGYTGYSLDWSANESNPRFYNLTKFDGTNTTVLLNGTWRGENISINVDGLDVGTYTFNMTMLDFFNQTAFAITIVEVTPDAHLPLVNEIRVFQAYTTATSNNVTVQAYVWDLNKIASITIEWYSSIDEDVNTADMELHSNDFYAAKLGEYSHGVTVYYRITAIDNSSVNNQEQTEWIEVDVIPLRGETTPVLLWVGILILGTLSTLALLVIYFRTKTK
ncbi:MAG: hypothetical protein JSW61_07755 [Candidatus Thorarchaeota archaeon]|nr:MAG: hypothetical protein JSW61_07755 [Candidatus Thorarchaeota archaeon]